jgi:hypothetical protein
LEKIKEKTIIITRAEGKTDLCGISHTFYTFAQAEAFLISEAPSIDSLGGDKYDFEVVFSDNCNYTGTILVKHNWEANVQATYSVRRHIRDYADYIIDAEWTDRQTMEKWTEFLATYDI